jgi:hypothetical protein
MGRRKPNVTEQIELTQLCIEVDKRKAREAEERAEPDPPPGITSIPYTSGWWPNGWLDEDLNGNLFASGADGLDRVICALAQLVKLALTHPGLSDTERTFYRRNAGSAREGYVMGTRRYAQAYLREANARHEARQSGKVHPEPDEAVLAACSAIPLDRLRRIATLGGHEGAVAIAELNRRGEA